MTLHDVRSNRSLTKSRPEDIENEVLQKADSKKAVSKLEYLKKE